jgi:hypothetical protein
MDRQLVGTPPRYAAASVQIVWNAQKNTLLHCGFVR